MSPTRVLYDPYAAIVGDAPLLVISDDPELAGRHNAVTVNGVTITAGEFEHGGHAFTLDVTAADAKPPAKRKTPAKKAAAKPEPKSHPAAGGVK